MALTTRANLDVRTVNTNPLDLRTPRDKLRLDWRYSTSDGTGPGQADAIWHDSVTAPIDIDVLSLTDAWGVPFSFAQITAISCECTSGAGLNIDWNGIMSGSILTAPLWSGGALHWTGASAVNVNVGDYDTISIGGAGTLSIIIVGVKV